MKITMTLLLVCLQWFIQCGYAQAQDYPNRPVQVLIGFPPGGSADILGRHIMQKVSEVSGRSFLVENRTGAGGNLAFSAVALAKPDGYTLLFSTPGIAINPSLYKKINYKIEDFTPIALIGDAPLVLSANPALPIKSVSDLIAVAKKSPDSIRFASSGNGSSSHLAMDVIRAMTGIQYIHIPYRGGGAAMLDVISGQADITMQPITETMPYVKDGKLRPLGQTGLKRSLIAPEIPTIDEAGVKGYSTTTWYMVLGPANLPKNIVQYLQTEILKAVNSPEVKEKLLASGVTIVNGGPSEAKELLYSDYKKWADRIKSSGTVIE